MKYLFLILILFGCGDPLPQPGDCVEMLDGSGTKGKVIKYKYGYLIRHESDGVIRKHNSGEFVVIANR